MKDLLYPLVGKRIQEIRKENNVNQQELADFLNLSRTSVSNIENGRHPIFIHHIYTIAEKFNVPIEKILPSVFDIQNHKKLQNKDWVNMLEKEGVIDENTVSNFINIINKI